MAQRDLAFLLPGDPEARTGGTIYDRRIVDALRDTGRRVDLHRLGDGFPNPSAEELAAAAAILGQLPDRSLVVVDGLAFSAMPEIVEAEAERLDLVALIHHPLALETGLDAAARARLLDLETRALRAARRVIVTSGWTVRDLAPYDVDPSRIDVVLPGTDPAPLSRGGGGTTSCLLCVASLTPRKGHLVLIDALVPLLDRRWRLVCAGSPTRDPAAARAIMDAVERRGLARRVTFTGEIAGAALDAAYDAADLFVLPSFHEGYGMAYAEALARGLPVIGTTAGAIPQTVPASAGLLVPPGDAAALTAALARFLEDRELRASLRRGAASARQRLPDWPAAGRAFAAVLDTV